jgi:hypothetical protein
MALVGFWVVAGIGIGVQEAASTPWLVLPFLLAGIYVALYFIVYFNVALAAAAEQSIEGRDTGLRDGLRVARTRRGIVAKWALLELVLGLLLTIIGSLLNNAGARVVANLLSAAAGLGWSVATFFVIPVLALEGLGPRDAMNRSVNLIRSHWGEAVVGRTGIGMVVFLIAFPPIAGLSVLATGLEPDNPALAGVAYALFTVVALVAIVVSSALSVIFRVEVFRWATAGELGRGFTRDDVLAAFRSAPDDEPEPEPKPEPEPEPEPEPASKDKARLEKQLYKLADHIGDKDESDRFWSAKVRACADQVRAGHVWGLRNFLGLFGGMGSINDQPFSGVLGRELSKTHELASSLLREIAEESSRARESDVVHRPWSEGHTGKAVVYRDGTVVATQDVEPGKPTINDIRNRSERPVAMIGIAPDGSCDVYSSNCDERWLAVQLRNHNPALHLGPPQA